MIILIYSMPLIASIIIMLQGRKVGKEGTRIIGIMGIGGSMIISIKYGINYITRGEIYKGRWKEEERIGIGIRIDKYTIIMLIIITIMTLIIIIYSLWYLEEDPNINWYISNMLIFSVSMCILVSASTLITFYIGWELIGLMSFNLITYWSNSIRNYKAGIKALLFNKIGDILLLWTIITLRSYNSSLEFDSSFNIIDNKNFLTFSLFFAAIIKSAQFLFHPWLSDAMAGPTPVSSLLHAATMVTGGIILLIRGMEFEKVEWEIRNLAIPFGLITTIFSGIVAFNQYDIKKIIAYSTCSHLGLMLFSLSSNKEISFLHIFSHAWLKGLIFLSSGLIIHLYSTLYSKKPSQDLRSFSLISYITPYYSILLLIPTLSLIGFPGLSGSISKEKILWLSWIRDETDYIKLIIGGILSLFYSFYIINIFFKIPNSSIYNPSLNWSVLNYSNLGTKWLTIFFISSILIVYVLYNIFLSPLDSLLNIEILLPYDNLWGIIYRALGIELIIIYWIIKRIVKGIKVYKQEIIAIINIKFCIDYLQNYWLMFTSLSSSYFIFVKTLDRGILEWIGPLGIARIIKQTKTNTNINQNLILIFILYLIFLFCFFSFAF